MKKTNLIVLLSLLILGFSCKKENTAPTCEILEPSNNAAFTSNDTIKIVVEADDIDDNLKEVQFYYDNTLLGRVSSEPYIYEWITQDIANGTHTIKAVACDENMERTTDIINVEFGYPPIADFTANEPIIYEGEIITFSDESSNTPTSWNWDFGDGNHSTNQTPLHSYSTGGTYSVKLTVTNNFGDDTVTKVDYITILNIPNCGPVTDIDGNVYNVIAVGTQIWMVENLKTTKYRDGTSIPNVTVNSDWRYLTTGAYCNYDNTSPNSNYYGRLYNWYAVNDAHNIAPTGWHVPTDEEWSTLISYLGGFTQAGGKLKESGTSHWDSPNTGATNETGFTALPGGYRWFYGEFEKRGYWAGWWSSTEDTPSQAWYRRIDASFGNAYRDQYPMNIGMSIRCIKD